jgi:hypothetical protein
MPNGDFEGGDEFRQANRHMLTLLLFLMALLLLLLLLLLLQLLLLLLLLLELLNCWEVSSDTRRELPAIITAALTHSCWCCHLLTAPKLLLPGLACVAAAAAAAAGCPSA